MPPDIQGAVHKFVPNNAKLAGIVTKVLRQVFQVHSLPLPLVKLVVERAFEQSRQMEMKVESSVFEEKLLQYAQSVRPRFQAQINEIRRRGKSFS